MFQDIGRTIGQIFGAKKKKEERPRPFTGVATTPPLRQQQGQPIRPQPFQQQAQGAFQQPQAVRPPVQPSIVGQPIQAPQPVAPMRPITPIASTPGQFVRKPIQIAPTQPTSSPFTLNRQPPSVPVSQPGQFVRQIPKPTPNPIGHTISNATKNTLFDPKSNVGVVQKAINSAPMLGAGQLPLAQGIARGFDQLGRSIAEAGGSAFAGNTGAKFGTGVLDDTKRPTILGVKGTEGAAEVLYGKDPVKSIQSDAKNIGIAASQSNNPYIKAAAPLAPFAAPVMAGLDAAGLVGMSGGAAAGVKAGLESGVKMGLTQAAKPKVALKTLDELGGMRPENTLQTQIEQAHNMGDSAKIAQLTKGIDPGMNPEVGMSAAAKADYVTQLSKPKVELKTPDVQVPLEVTNAGTLRGGFAKAVIDREAPVVDYLKNIEKQTGQKGLVDQFYYDTGLQRRSNAVANSRIQNSKELEGALRGLKGKSKEEFDAYAAARNELSNAERGLPTTAPVEDLKLLVDNLAPKHGQRFEQLNKFYKDLAGKQREAGIIDDATYKQFISNPDYSRIQRDMSDLANPRGRGGNSYSLGTSITGQKRKGSSRAIQPADVTAFNYAQQVQKEIQRNQTASNLIDVLASQGHARQLTPKEAVNKNTLKRIVDGKTEVWEVPKDIKEIADNVKPYQLGPWQQIVSAPQRLLRAGATGLNPTFTASNYVKDQVSSAIFSKTPTATHTPANAARGLGHAAKDFAGGSDDPFYQKFIQHAGDTTQYDQIRNVKNARQLSREIRGGAKGKIASKIMNPIRTLEDLNQVTEKATRYQNFKGTYDKVLKKTGNEEEALKQATLASWQNSVDFSRMGEITQAVNLLIPYFNAGIQGTRLLGRNLKERPVGTVSKIGGLLASPVVGATVYNTSDPERKKIYDNISDYEKENNVIVITPGAKQLQDGSYEGVIKIPLQPGTSNLVQPLRLAAEAYANGKQTDLGKSVQLAAGAATGPLNTSSPGGLLGSFIPQAVKPTVQQFANKDFYSGKEVVPDFVNEATDSKGNPVKESDKAFNYTSGSSKLIGKALNVSPIRVDKFIKDTSGKVGQYAQNVVDTGLAKAKVIPEDQIGGVNFPEDFARRFSQASSKYNYKKSEGGKYFDEVKKVTEKLNVNEKGAFQALHPQTKNFKGDQIYEREAVYDPAARLDVYNRFPKVFEADKRLDAQAQKRGNPGNPMFKLENWQLKKVLEKENLPPGAKDPELSNLRDQDWYADYSTKKSDYFTQLSEKAKKEGKTFGTKDNPYPATPPDLQKIMNDYSSLPKGTRKSWINSNPGQYKRMQDQYASIDNWQNIQRGKRGLDATEGALGEASGYSSGSSGYASRGRGGGSSRGGGGGGGGGDDLGKSSASYAVSIKAGGSLAKPKVTKKPVKAITFGKAGGVAKPKVALKKGSMKGKKGKA